MKDRKPLQLRLPTDIKVWIQDQAEKNGSSQNGEVIRAVRDRMAQVEQQLTQ